MMMLNFFFLAANQAAPASPMPDFGKVLLPAIVLIAVVAILKIFLESKNERRGRRRRGRRGSDEAPGCAYVLLSRFFGMIADIIRRHAASKAADDGCVVYLPEETCRGKPGSPSWTDQATRTAAHDAQVAEKGEDGESLAAMTLADWLAPNIYHIVNDVMLPDGMGGTTQIDHVVVSKFGVFCVETKNHSGTIYGDMQHDHWLEYYNGNRVPTRFQNPFRQSYKHLCVFSKDIKLPMEAIHHVVFFVGRARIKMKGELPPGLCQTGAAVSRYVHSFAVALIDDADVTEILRRIEMMRVANTAANRAAHVDYLHRTHGA